MTIKQICDAIKNGEFEDYQFNRIIEVARRAQQEAQWVRQSRLAKSSPEDLMPETWYCFSDMEDTKKAIQELNSVGVKLVAAIREESLKKAREVIGDIVKVQSKWSHVGAADSEGRDAIFHIIQGACAGTNLEPEYVWEKCYRY
jgi:hypothetical protein